MKKSIGLLLLLLLFLVSGCSETKDIENGKIFKIYYLNNAETKVDSYEYVVTAADQKNQIEELMLQLQKIPEKLEYKAPLAFDFQLLDYSLKDECILLNFDEKYNKLSVTTEVLIRAALVRTLTQIEGIEYVAITVEDVPFVDSLGMPVGMLSESNFIDNAGSEISTYETVKLKLYFADDTGSQLIEETRIKEYNSNISMERLVVEEIIKGPSLEKNYPTINPETKIISVSVQDGICYLNLDETFLTQIYNVSSEVTIYSIVNSLIELSSVNQVQISIQGETDLMYRETFDLKTVFKRNLDLVVK